MIITRQKNVPWLWVFMTYLPWAAMLFASAVATVVMTLELRKFTANPATIAMLTSLIGLCWMIINPITHFLSDRIWTRWGRRKVFYVPAIFTGCLAIILIPFAKHIGVLFAGFVIYSVSAVISQPKTSLSMEVVPNHQRGRGSVLQTIFVQTGLFAYNIALIGRFDDVVLNIPLRIFDYIKGEKLIFWVFAAALFSVVLIVSLGIKEMRPSNYASLRDELGGRVNPYRFVVKLFTSTFSAAWWPIYLLGLSQVLYGLNLGAMVALMYTDQWGYSIQQLGTNQAISQLAAIFCSLFMIGIIDRFDRLQTFRGIIIIGLLLKSFWYVFVMFMAPEQRPELWQILVMGEGIMLIGTFVGTTINPLIFEFVPVSKVGTANAGLAICMGMFSVPLGIMNGIWIKGYSELFYPAAGSEVVMVLDAPASEAEAEGWMIQWEEQTGSKYDVRLFKPGTIRADSGRQWTVRIEEPEAEADKKRLDKLNQKLDQMGAREKYLKASGQEVDLAALKQERADLIAERDRINDDLDARVTALETFITEQFGDRLSDPAEAVAAMSYDGNELSMTLPVVYAVPEKLMAGLQEEVLVNIEQYGWENIRLQNTGSADNPQIEVKIDRIDAQEQLESVEPVFERMIDGYFARHGSLDLDATQKRNLAHVIASLSDGLGGVRCNLLRPFPEGIYKPQKYDYFSSYLLMILTDFGAIYILWFLRRKEKQGKIKRLGAIEERRSREGTARTEGGTAAPTEPDELEPDMWTQASYNVPARLKLFSFSGRLRRTDLLVFSIFIWLGLYPLNKVLSAGLGSEHIGYRVVMIALGIPAVWIFSALLVKRLHDCDRGGLSYVLWMLLPAVLLFGAAPALGWTGGWRWLLLIPQLWFVFKTATRKGTEGPNRFGDDPKRYLDTH